MDQEFYKFGKRVIENDMLVLNNIYIDIEFLKYISLGSILSHPDLTPCIYADVLKIITNNDFISRYTDDPQVLFKDIEKIDKVLNSSHKTTDDVILSISPAFDGPIDFINNCIIRSDRSKDVIRSNTPTKISVDISSLGKISDVICRRMLREYTELFGVEVEAIRKPIPEHDELILQFDGYFISNISRFNKISINFLNEEKMIEKYIFCSKILPLHQLPHVQDNIIPLTFHNIELVMTAASRFFYIQPFACLT